METGPIGSSLAEKSARCNLRDAKASAAASLRAIMLGGSLRRERTIPKIVVFKTLYPFHRLASHQWQAVREERRCQPFERQIRASGKGTVGARSREAGIIHLYSEHPRAIL